MQDDAEKGFVYVESAVVTDEAQFPKFVHEQIDSGPRSADHLSQQLLGHFGYLLAGFILCAVACEQ